MRNHTIKGLALVAGAFLVTIALSASANATTLRHGNTASGATVTGTLPGQVLWSYYETTATLTPCSSVSSSTPAPDHGCDNAGGGDNIIRVINPTGSADTQIGGTSGNTICAMIYVFDDDEEMGECCGCPISSAGLVTFSVESNLTANWGGFNGGAFKGAGSVVIVAAPQNLSLINLTGSPSSNGQFCNAFSAGGLTCNLGCDPTATPGYSVTNTNNLFASITHNQIVANSSIGTPTSSGLTEIGFFDDAGGDPTNLTYLEQQCGSIAGNGSSSAVCKCPGGSSDFFQ